MAINENALYHAVLKSDYHQSRVPQISAEPRYPRRRNISEDHQLLYPPPQVADYIRKALPPVPNVPKRNPSRREKQSLSSPSQPKRNPSRREDSGIQVKMTFGVLSSGPRRYTLTDMKGYVGPAAEAANPQRRLVHLTTENTPLQSPQPQQPTTKIMQLTGYGLSDQPSFRSNQHRRNTSAKIKQLTGYDLSIAGMGKASDHFQNNPIETSMLMSDSEGSKRSSSIYSRSEGGDDVGHNETEQTSKLESVIGHFSTWKTSEHVGLAGTKRISDDSVKTASSGAYSLRSQFVPTGLHVAPLTLRTRDRPQTPSNGGLANGKAEPYPVTPYPVNPDRMTRSSDTDDENWQWGADGRGRHFAFGDDAPTATASLQAGENAQSTSLVRRISAAASATGRRPYSPSIESFQSPDVTAFALNPRLAPSQRHHTSRFSDSEDESASDGGFSLARGRESVLTGIRNISKIKKPNRPSSIRTVSSTYSKSSNRFPNLSSPLRNPFSFSNKFGSPDSNFSTTSLSEDGDEKRTGHRISSAMRSLSSKTSTSAPSTAPTSPQKEKDTIRERVIMTPNRKPGGPDTPFPRSFRKKSFGPSLSEKEKEYLRQLNTNEESDIPVPIPRTKKTRGKGILRIAKGVVGDVRTGWESKTIHERKEEERLQERRKEIMKSIRVVRHEGEEKDLIAGKTQAAIVFSDDVGGSRASSLVDGKSDGDNLESWV